MSSYLIKRAKENNEITYMSYDFEGYNFKPKNNNKNYLNVNNIMIVKPDMISKILHIKFNKIYSSSNLTVKMIFSDVILDYKDYMQSTNKDEYTNRTSLEIKC